MCILQIARCRCNAITNTAREECGYSRAFDHVWFYLSYHSSSFVTMCDDCKSAPSHGHETGFPTTQIQDKFVQVLIHTCGCKEEDVVAGGPPKENQLDGYKLSKMTVKRSGDQCQFGAENCEPSPCRQEDVLRDTCVQAGMELEHGNSGLLTM